MEEPITEQSNVLSTNIDTASPTEIASIFYACDQEIFKGWNGSKGLKDKLVFDKIEKIAEKIAEVIEIPSGSVIISGCGTSGRLAFLTVQTFNRYLKSRGKAACFRYLIAGEDRALFQSAELAEDDPVAGVRSLKQVTEDKTAVVYIGVTCGLSAPFIAGQLDHCLSHLDTFTPVLIGFNNASQARQVAIEKLDKTFRQVVQEMEAAEESLQAYILNPIIGPEPITGSSRMKSGTTTRILLDILSIVAVHNYSKDIIPQLVAMYEIACHSVYKHSQDLGSLIQLAGSSLIAGGHIYYLGSDGFGLTAMIDASECVPTFGASFHDIRGFVDGGFRRLENNDGDISHLGEQYRISVENFDENILPHLQSHDLVVLLGQDLFEKYRTTLSTLPSRKAAVFITCNDEEVTRETQDLDLVLTMNIDVQHTTAWTPECAQVLLKQLLLETSVKWLLNGLSTGAHVLHGKVYHNIMIDLRVSNKKLFYRAAGIVQKYCSLTIEEATSYLLRSIYGTDSLTEEQKSSQVEKHIMAASLREKVVPAAMLMASLKCSVNEAKSIINNQPIISKLFQPRDKPGQ